MVEQNPKPYQLRSSGGRVGTAATDSACSCVLPKAATMPKGKVAADDSRFWCPFPGCNRSFGELWRLKVHYRAPPDVRGSGKERGHGTELQFCPKCDAELKPGKHHVGCVAGRSARRSVKRVKQVRLRARRGSHSCRDAVMCSGESGG